MYLCPLNRTKKENEADLTEISDDCAHALICLNVGECLFYLIECDECEDNEKIEGYYLALLDFLRKYDPESDYCEKIKKLLLGGCE